MKNKIKWSMISLLFLAGCVSVPQNEEMNNEPEIKNESKTCKTLIDGIMEEKGLTYSDETPLLWQRGGKTGDQFSIDLARSRISVKDPEITYGEKEPLQEDLEHGILLDEETDFLYRYSYEKDSFITNGDPEENTATMHKELQKELTEIIETLKENGCPSLYKKGEEEYQNYDSVNIESVADKDTKIIDPMDVMKCTGLSCELRNDPDYTELDDAYSLDLPKNEHYSNDLQSLIKPIKKAGQNNRVGFNVIFTHGSLNDPDTEAQSSALLVQNFIRDVYLPESKEVGPYLYFVDLDKSPLEAAVSIKGIDERYTTFSEDVPNSMHAFVWDDDQGLIYDRSWTNDEDIVDELWNQLQTKAELTGNDLSEKYGEEFLENYKHLFDFDWQRLHGLRESYQSKYGF